MSLSFFLSLYRRDFAAAVFWKVVLFFFAFFFSSCFVLHVAASASSSSSSSLMCSATNHQLLSVYQKHSSEGEVFSVVANLSFHVLEALDDPYWTKYFGEENRWGFFPSSSRPSFFFSLLLLL